MLQMPIGDTVLCQILAHALRARFKRVIGPNATWRQAKTELYMLHTFRRHRRDAFLYQGFRAEWDVEAQQGVLAAQLFGGSEFVACA